MLWFILILLIFGLVFGHHHLDGVLNSSKMLFFQWITVLFTLYHFTNSREDNQFLFFHVHGQFSGTLVEMLRNFE